MRMHFGRNFLVVAGIILLLFKGITEMVCLAIAAVFAGIVIIKRLFAA